MVSTLSGSGTEGAAMPSFSRTGLCSTRISSQSPARMNAVSRQLPPSTINELIFIWLYSLPTISGSGSSGCSRGMTVAVSEKLAAGAEVNTTVGIPSFSSRQSPRLPSRDRTTRSGLLPCHRRTVSDGLSSRTVAEPTMMALYSLRS